MATRGSTASIDSGYHTTEGEEQNAKASSSNKPVEQRQTYDRRFGDRLGRTPNWNLFSQKLDRLTRSRENGSRFSAFEQGTIPEATETSFSFTLLAVEAGKEEHHVAKPQISGTAGDTVGIMDKLEEVARQEHEAIELLRTSCDLETVSAQNGIAPCPEIEDTFAVIYQLIETSLVETLSLHMQLLSSTPIEHNKYIHFFEVERDTHLSVAEATRRESSEHSWSSSTSSDAADDDDDEHVFNEDELEEIEWSQLENDAPSIPENSDHEESQDSSRTAPKEQDDGSLSEEDGCEAETEHMQGPLSLNEWRPGNNGEMSLREGNTRSIKRRLISAIRAVGHHRKSFPKISLRSTRTSGALASHDMSRKSTLGHLGKQSRPNFSWKVI